MSTNTVSGYQGVAAGTGPATVVASGEPVGIVVEEKLVVSLNKDGGMENMEVQGTMSLQVWRVFRMRREGLGCRILGWGLALHPHLCFWKRSKRIHGLKL